MKITEHRHAEKAQELLRRSGYGAGPDAKEDRTMVTKGVHQHEAHMHRGEAKTVLHLARGGHVGKPKGKANVNIIIAAGEHDRDPAQMTPPPMIPGGGPPRAPMAPPPQMAPHPPMGGAPMPGGMLPPGMRARGGPAMKGGAGGGLGRLEKARAYGKRGK